MAEIGATVHGLAKTAYTYLLHLLSYVLAGGSLIATVALLIVLHDIISQTRASYPALRPITGNSLAKPIFLRSSPVETPKSFAGTALSVSPDGKMVAYWGTSADRSQRGLFIAGVNGGADRYIWPFVTWQGWAPDSKKLVLLARRGEQGVAGVGIVDLEADYDPAAGTSVDWLIAPEDASAPNPPLPVTATSWSPDAKSVFFVQPKPGEGLSELWRLEVEGGQRQRLAVLPKEPDKPNTYMRSLSISPDGKKVTFVNADRAGAERSSTWWIVNSDGSSPLPLIKRGQETGFVQKWQWSPDGRQLMYDIRMLGDGQYQPTTLWLMNGDGTARRQISVSDNIDGFTMAPKGNWAIYGRESHLWLVNLENGQEEQLTFGDDNESRPIWLANGDVLYHHRVGSVTSLRLLEHAEPADIPGLAAPVPTKAP